jgi:hypothetical protein
MELCLSNYINFVSFKLLLIFLIFALFLSFYFSRLYTMDGEQIQHSSQLQNGQCYVASNKEKFKRVEYFPPEEFGMSPRALRKA